jgi:hypothetical protein
VRARLRRGVGRADRRRAGPEGPGLRGPDDVPGAVRPQDRRAGVEEAGGAMGAAGVAAVGGTDPERAGLAGGPAGRSRPTAPLPAPRRWGSSASSGTWSWRRTAASVSCGARRWRSAPGRRRLPPSAR